MHAVSPIVLVHGAWSNGRTWDAVARLLRAQGHKVVVVDLPSHGDDTTPPADVGLSHYGQHIIHVIKDLKPVLLVGHSMGGMAISSAAQHLPAKVRKLVFIAAFLPKDGQSLLDLIKLQKEAGLRDAIRPAQLTGTTELIPEVAGEILFQDATPSQRIKGLNLLNHQPNRPQTDQIRLSSKNFGSVPRCYIKCHQDRTVLPELQQLMLKNSPCDEVFSMDSGHVPQLTRPKELAEILAHL